MPNRLMILTILFSMLLFIACNSSSENGEEEPTYLGGPCHTDGTCDGILVCINDVCKYPPTEDGDEDLEPEIELEAEAEEEGVCQSTLDCEEGYICISYKCVEEVVDGDTEEMDVEEELEPEDEANPDGPVLSVWPDPANFGSVPENASSNRIISIQNVGKMKLLVEKITIEMNQVNQAFGSFEFTAPVGNDILMDENEILSISIDFNRDYASDTDVEADLVIQSNSITGEFTRIRMYSPSSHSVNLLTDPETIEFGQVPLGRTKDVVLQVLNPSLEAEMGDLLIESFEITEGSEYFSIGSPSPSVPRTIEPDDSPMLIPVVAYSKEGGESLNKTGILALYHNDPTKAYPLEIPLSMAVIFPELAVEPTELDFGSVPVGDTTSLLVTLRNHGGEAVIVDSANFQNFGATNYFSINVNPIIGGRSEEALVPLGDLPATIPAGDTDNKRVIQLDFNPLAFGDHVAEIALTSNDVRGEDVVISMGGQGIPPMLTILPGTLSFPPVQVGHDDERTVTITYGGNGLVEIKDAFIEDHFLFKISEAPTFPLTLDSNNRTAEIKVTYQPVNMTLVPDTSSLTIVIGSEDTINYDVPISGTAITANIEVTFDNQNTFKDVQIVPDSIPAINEMTEAQANVWVERGTVVITNPGTAPLHISSILPTEASADVFGVDTDDLPITVQPGETNVFDILFAPRTMTNYQGRIVICSDATNASGSFTDCDQNGHKSSVIEIVRIPTNLQMIVDVPGGFLEFDQPDPNGYTTANVTITNIGTAPIHLDRIDVINSGDDEVFFIDNIIPAAGAEGWDLINSPSASIQIEMRFEPPGEGAQSGALIIEHNDKDASADGVNFSYPQYSVTLSGNGQGNTPPVAIVKSPHNTPEGPVGTHFRAVLKDTQIFLDGSASYDEDDDTSDFVDAYRWSIVESSGFEWQGDPPVLTESSAQITFSETGHYTINLEVEDLYGGISAPTPNSTIDIHVQEDPIAVIDLQNEDLQINDFIVAYLKEPVLFDGTESYDPDGQIVGYRWYYIKVEDDETGMPELFSTEAQPSFVFPEKDHFYVYLEVEDNDGRVSPEMDKLYVEVQGNDTLRIEAVWTNGGNVDLHYIAPGGSMGTPLDCSVSQTDPDWGAYGTPHFIQGSTNGSRPEIIIHNNAADDSYTVRAQYVSATENCVQEQDCTHYSKNCNICGCSCWAPICLLQIDSCCKSCDECTWYTVCTQKKASVTFYVYVNDEADPLRVVNMDILESPGYQEFTLIREEGIFY